MHAGLRTQLVDVTLSPLVVTSNLCVDSNKTEHEILASAIQSSVTPEGKLLVTTKEKGFHQLICNPAHTKKLTTHAHKTWSKEDHGACH